MAAYDLQEQEQLDEIKAFWKMYGNRIVNVVFVIILGVAAWQGWEYYQNRASGEASTLFYTLQKAMEDKSEAGIKTSTEQLFDKYGRTSYAGLGGLFAAKAMIEMNDPKTARVQLAWVAEHGQEDFKELARLRLATLLLDEKDYDAALKTLDGKINDAFAVRFSDLRGDAMFAKGDKEAALKAWKEAEGKRNASERTGASGELSSAFMDVLRQKIEMVSGEAK